MGRRFTDKEVASLCFDFGIELDDVTSPYLLTLKEKGEKAAEGLSKEVVYKIDVPANRYDILCLEGIARALRIFLLMEPVPKYRIAIPKNKIQLIIKPQTSQIREFAVCAVLRNITLTQSRYESFIDLQDKLHQNIGRRRALLAIGTHDLDTLTPPFTYEALPRKNIRFVPLNEKKEFNGDELFEHYKKPGCHLAPYLPLTENSPVQPVIFDSKRVVLSLPPIINSEHSKLIPNKTRNIFIECTGTDWTKLNIALNMMVTMFTQYCEEPFSIEGCDVVTAKGETIATPDLSDNVFEADPVKINKGLGIQMEPEAMAAILSRMQLPSCYDANTKQMTVRAPPTRNDIFHACDIQEDVAIAYGYNNIKKTIPACHTEGRAQPLNKLSDQVREIVAQAGYLEVLTWILGNHEEHFDYRNKKDNGTTCVKIANQAIAEFNIVRTSLIPGLLKTMHHNHGRVALPVKIFELSDVVLKDNESDVGARNHRRLGALFCGNVSGFEVIHGLLDRVLGQLGAVFKLDATADTKRPVYEIRKSDDPAMFPGRAADIFLDGKKLGVFGIVHPSVLDNFEISSPCTVLEIDIEPFLR